jgi:hypothetical protein
MRAIALVLCTALGLAGSTTAFAQRPGGPGAGAGGPGAGAAQGPQAAQRREKIKKRIRALRAFTLTDELSLDEATAGKLFPILAKYDDEIDKQLQLRADLQRQLAASGDLHDAKALDRLIDASVANQHGFWELEDKRLAELRKVLTPNQTARLLVVLPALERKIQNQLQRAIEGKAGPGGGGGGKPGQGRNRPNFDDDDDDDVPAPGPRRGAGGRP